jgi:hypothetical protein
MRLVIGMILGVLLTVATAFVYDSITGRAPNGLTICVSRRTRTRGELGCRKKRLG